MLEEKGSVILNKWSRKPSWDKRHNINDPEDVGVQYIFLNNTVPALVLFVCLAVLGLKCSTWDLLLQCAGSVVVLRRLSFPAACGILVFGPEI